GGRSRRGNRADGDVGVLGQPRVPRGVRRRDRLRLLPLPDDEPRRRRAARPRRRRAGRGRRPRVRDGLLLRPPAAGAAMSENGSGGVDVDPGASPRGAAPPKLRLGGMALRNGLLIHGPTSWAAAARDENGHIAVASGPKPTFAPGATAAVPLLRGPLRL